MEHVVQSDPASVERALNSLRNGGVIVYPTDTAYALGADALNAEALKKIFVIKGRDEGKPLPVIVGGEEKAREIAVFPESAERLAHAFWPGALTLVLAAQPSMLPMIGNNEGTIGIRVPASSWCRELCDALGSPITSTSANAAGSPAEYDIDGVMKSLGVQAPLVDLWVDGGSLAHAPVSSVVRVTDRIEVLREGAISREKIERMLK